MARPPSDLPKNPPRPYTDFELLTQNDFPSLVARRFLVAAAKDAAEEQLKDLNGTICGMMLACGLVSSDAVEVADVGAIKLVQGRSASTLDEKKLLEAGVSPDVINAAKTPGTPYWYVQRVKEK